MHIRENTYDAFTLKEINRSYGWMNTKGKVVLDIGGHIGSAAVLFANGGARKVISIEPDKDNFRMLQKNTKGLLVELINAACVENPALEQVLLYTNKGMNKGMHSLVVKRGRGVGILVDAVQFSKLLKKYKPSVLKIDIEGAEYDILTQPLPAYVKEVTMEIHFGKRVNREVRAPELIKLFKGWECIKKPKLDGKNWTTIGAWKR